MKYLIKMMDNSELIVPEKVGEAILEAKTDRIVWNKIMINLRSVSKVQPVTETPEVITLQEPKKFSKVDRVRALEQLAVGLTRFIKHNEHSEKSLDILKLINRKLAEAKLMPKNKITRNPLDEIRLSNIRF